MARRRRNDHWLNTPWWILTLGEWIGLVLALGAIVSLLCILFIRRHTLEYHLEHTFAVSDAEFLGSALAISDPVPIEGNAIEVLQNGDEYFPAMLDAIRAAKKTINFEAYIVYSDEVGRAFCEALSECARAGVEVRVLLDGVGSSWSLNNSDVQMMKRAGCKFTYYHPTHSWRVDRTNRRSHRRVLVVDGRIGFTGGVGFAKRWGGHAQDKEHWRDTGVRVEGPIVNRLQSAFSENWVEETGEIPAGPKYERRGIERCGSVSRADGSRKFESADCELAFVFHRAGAAGASGRVCRRQETHLDHERLLHSNARSGGTVDQGGQTRSRCPDYGPGRKQRSAVNQIRRPWSVRKVARRRRQDF